MQQPRVSRYTAYMYLGELIEFGDTSAVFTNPNAKKLKTTSLAALASDVAVETNL